MMIQRKISYRGLHLSFVFFYFSFKSASLSWVALLDIVADFFFTNSGNISPVAIPVVETVFLLHSLASSSARSSILETGGFSGGEESEEDKQADKESLHSCDVFEVFLRCFDFDYILA